MTDHFSQVEDVTMTGLTPEYIVFLYALFLAMLCGVFARRFFGQGAYSCLFCGTKTGRHAPDCRWADRRRQERDTDE